MEKLITALEQIATGRIEGEEKNYKLSLEICRQIAKEALENFAKKIKNK